MQGKTDNTAGDLFAELEAFGAPKKPQDAGRAALQTPRANLYYQVGTVNHKSAMNAFLKEASEYDKLSHHSKKSPANPSEDGGVPAASTPQQDPKAAVVPVTPAAPVGPVQAMKAPVVE